MNKLDEILAFKREEVAQSKRKKPLGFLEKELQQRPPVRDFRAAISRRGRLSLIAEIKKASPSAGPIHPGADVLKVAQAYVKAGAQAVSVLTDSRFFSGSLSDLSSVKREIAVPVLRKDFILEEYQVIEAAAAGADAALLIAAILPRPDLKRLIGLAQDLSLEGLVEVHTERELGEALEAGARMVGVNNRDLNTFQVDLKTTQRLMGKIPSDRTRVSESGLRSAQDVEFVRTQGADAVLIGEELMNASEIGLRAKELMGWS